MLAESSRTTEARISTLPISLTLLSLASFALVAVSANSLGWGSFAGFLTQLLLGMIGYNKLQSSNLLSASEKRKIDSEFETQAIASMAGLLSGLIIGAVVANNLSFAALGLWVGGLSGMWIGTFKVAHDYRVTGEMVPAAQSHISTTATPSQVPHPGITYQEKPISSKQSVKKQASETTTSSQHISTPGPAAM